MHNSAKHSSRSSAALLPYSMWRSAWFTDYLNKRQIDYPVEAELAVGWETAREIRVAGWDECGFTFSARKWKGQLRPTLSYNGKEQLASDISRHGSPHLFFQLKSKGGARRAVRATQDCHRKRMSRHISTFVEFFLSRFSTTLASSSSRRPLIKTRQFTNNREKEYDDKKN